MRSRSNEMESPEMRNSLDSQERPQRTKRSVSMPERAMPNMATGIEKRASVPTTMLRSPSVRENPEDTIDEESIDEFGQAIKLKQGL